MHKYYELGNRSLEISTNAHRAWNDIKFYKRGNSKHLVWWKLSILYKNDFDCITCKDTYEVGGNGCQECCPHEFDADEGGMCLNCGRDDYYNFIDEDYGQER